MNSPSCHFPCYQTFTPREFSEKGNFSKKQTQVRGKMCLAYFHVLKKCNELSLVLVLSLHNKKNDLFFHMVDSRSHGIRLESVSAQMKR